MKLLRPKNGFQPNYPAYVMQNAEKPDIFTDSQIETMRRNIQGRKNGFMNIRRWGVEIRPFSICERKRTKYVFSATFADAKAKAEKLVKNTDFILCGVYQA